MKWSEIIADKSNVGKWFALTDCEFEGECLEACVVADEDFNLANLEERLATKGVDGCIIKFCGESAECGESPRVTRSTIIDGKPR